ncbi:integrase catalytic domain-containing protein [Nephila pilipes]|uniref:Integrase catalytic domain-containing protein n=1 Tax=Nephila pilipes TaxID=299642 RepID=A0A8X6UML8_NEPPI|nr:integrase catalytic domain-containing protein [Nephila pilipes]
MRYVQSPFQHYHNISKRFTEINLDIIDPLLSFEGFRYCLTITSRYSHRSKAILMLYIQVESLASSLLISWIPGFEKPLVLTTGQGTKFEAQLLEELSKSMAFKRNRNTSYCPQSNGCIERWYRTLKGSIMYHENKGWTRTLPLILLG